VLIAGGDGKGQDFAPLRTAVDAHCRAVLLIGRDAGKIERALNGTAVRVEAQGTLAAALARAMTIVEPGDAVVLSPACASLDQFANYVERGERFIAEVRKHLGVTEIVANA
jgi:UDP-N-acetylmuramoylalanine--D-glutamate ligase